MQIKPSAALPTEAILYGAKSSPDEHESIPAQLRDGRLLAEREGLEVVAEYSEQDVSAWSGNRGPELAAALDHAGRIGGALIVQHPDRLARGDGKQARHLAELYFEALRAGVTLRACQDDSTFDNPILAVVMGERNEADSRRKSELVKAGHARSRAKGKVGGHRSLGYEMKRLSIDSDDREPVIVPAEAAIVRRIFDELLAGRSQLAIARDLAREKVATVNGGGWYASTVRSILANPVYTSLVRVGGRKGTEFVEASHAPIIERSRWLETQAAIKARAKTYKRGRAPKGSHIFRRGHLRCECGGSMVPRTERDGSEVYRCFNRLRDPENCSMPMIKRAEVDTAVFAYFEQAALDVSATRKQLSEARDRKLAEVGALLAAAEREAVEASDAIERIERDYTRGKLAIEDWQRMRDQLAPELEAANAARDRMRDQFAEVEADADFLSAEAGVVEELAAVRAAVAGAVTDAAGIEAVRAVLLRQFNGFVLHRLKTPPTDGTDVYLDCERWIEPQPNWQAIAGFDEEFRPVLRAAPLCKAANNSQLVRTG